MAQCYHDKPYSRLSSPPSTVDRSSLHARLLRCALLGAYPLRPVVDVQLGVHRHVVEDLSVVKSSDLDNALAGKGVTLTPHGRATVAATRGQNTTSLYRSEYIPEHGSDIISTVALDRVCLWRTLGDLEALVRVDGVGGVGGSCDLAAVKAVAEDLGTPLATAGELLGHHLRCLRSRPAPRSGHYRKSILRQAS